MLCGKPLLQYTAEAAQAARGLARVILSTEDPEIAEVGRRCGLEVPFLRPAELARDETPTLPVLQHAVRALEDCGACFDAVCLLEPTSPLRRPEDIDGCIELLERSGADAVMTVLPVPAEYNPHWVYFEDAGGFLRLSLGAAAPITRRQELPAAFHRDGSVYVTRRAVLLQQNSLYGTQVAGYVMRTGGGVNIDRPEDWERAEALVAAQAR